MKLLDNIFVNFLRDFGYYMDTEIKVKFQKCDFRNLIDFRIVRFYKISSK